MPKDCLFDNFLTKWLAIVNRLNSSLYVEFLKPFERYEKPASLVHNSATHSKTHLAWYDFSISRIWCKCMIDSEVKKKKNANNEDPNNKSNFLNVRYSSINDIETKSNNG